MFARLASRVRARPLAAAAAAALVSVPLTGAALVVHGTSKGKIYASDPATFLLREFEAVVDSEQLAALRAEAVRLMEEGRAVRYNFPPGKAGAAVSYGVLQRLSPLMCEFYADMAKRISDRLELPLMPTPASDNSSLSLLVYSAKGDHIDWHYDLNFYRGRHFTVLVPLIVQGKVDAQLQVAVPNGAQWSSAGGGAAQATAPLVRHASASQETVEAILGSGFSRDSGNAFPNASIQAVPTRVGAVVAFEGARVFHRVSPLGASEEPWKGSWQPPPTAASGTPEALRLARQAASSQGEGGDTGEEPLRVMLSMTFTTDPSCTVLSAFQRRLKDMTYFGLISALFG